MTTQIPATAAPRSAHARPLAHRVWTVVRLLFANPWTAVYTPLLILTFIWLMNIAIWALLRATVDVGSDADSTINGGALFLFVYMLVVAVQSVNQTFSLALGYGMTRRDFFLGSAVFYIILSVGYSAMLATLGLIESATNGWGIRLNFFSTSVIGLDGWWQGFVFGLLAFLLFCFIGAATASVYVRWRAMGMYVFWASVVVAFFGGAILTTWADGWPQVGQFFAVAGVLGSAAWSLIFTGLCALAAWLILRRATPSQG